MPPRLVLTDIEGTTTAIAFVHRTLFPFIAEALEEFIALHQGVPEVAAVLAGG
jgi:enolase-phosphatase E1